MKLVENMPANLYHSGPEVSVTKLKYYATSGQHGLAAEKGLIGISDETKRFGSAFHCSILEPKLFATEYITKPATYPAPASHAKVKSGEIGENHPLPWNANAKICETWELSQKAEIISSAEMESFRRMRQAVNEHPIAGAFMRTKGRNELSCFDVDPETGLALRARFDKLTESNVIVDFKSTVSARPFDFTKQCANLGYFIQAAFYMDMLLRNGHECEGFCFIAVEKKEPYSVLVCELDAVSIEKGRSEYRRLLALYKKCHDENHWPGYFESDEPYLMTLPRWCLNSQEIQDQVTYTLEVA